MQIKRLVYIRQSLERTDFMSIHFSAKRPTKLKTNKLDNNQGLQNIAKLYQFDEYNGEILVKKSRNVKVLIKKLDKLYNDNQKKKEKNKLSSKDCQKEIELVEKINEIIKDINESSRILSEERKKIISDKNLNEDNTLKTDWLHRLDYDTQTKDQDAQTVDV